MGGWWARRVRWPCRESNRGSCDTRAVTMSLCQSNFGLVKLRGKKLRLTITSNNRLRSSSRTETIVECSVCSFVMHARTQCRWFSFRPYRNRRASVCSHRLYECAHPEDGASSLLRSVNNYLPINTASCPGRRVLLLYLEDETVQLFKQARCMSVIILCNFFSIRSDQYLASSALDCPRLLSVESENLKTARSSKNPPSVRFYENSLTLYRVRFARRRTAILMGALQGCQRTA